MSRDGSTEMSVKDALSYFSISFYNTLHLSGGSQHVLGGQPMYDRDIPKFSKRAAGLKGGGTF
jgi:hypothetical protein